MKKLIAVCLASLFLLPTLGEDKFALKCNDLAFKFYKALLDSRGNENLVFSPISLYNTCAILHEGADGETANAFAKFLGIDDDNNPLIRYNDFNKDLQRNGCMRDFMFKSFNFLFLSDKFEFKKEFLAKIQNTDAKIYKLDFADTQNVVSKINETIFKDSKGFIKKTSISDKIQGDNSFALLNFALFSGLWNVAFDPINTKEMKFFQTTDTSFNVNMMNASSIEGQKYCDELKFEAVQLLYQGKRMSMILFVPKGIRSLRVAISHMDGEGFQNILDKLSGEGSKNVHVSMPKFKIDSSTVSIKEVLAKLGNLSLFLDSADFSKISEPLNSLSMGNFLHKATITVDEKKNKADSENLSNFYWGDNNSFVANRPFMFLVVDNQSGLICFMGHVYDPTKN